MRSPGLDSISGELNIACKGQTPRSTRHCWLVRRDDFQFGKDNVVCVPRVWVSSARLPGMASTTVTPQEQQNSDTSAWQVWRVIWAITRTVLVVALVWMGFAAFRTKFETVVFGILTLIYLDGRDHDTEHTRLFIEQDFVIRQYFIGLYQRLLGDDMTEAENAIKDERKRMDHSMPVLLIHAAGRAIATWIAIVYLVIAIALS